MPDRWSSRSLRVAFVLWFLIEIPSVRAAPEPAPIAFNVSFSAPAEHFADVMMTVPADGQPSIDLMMAVWSPGFYRVENYANRVVSFTAQTPDGKKLSVEQPQKNRWRVRTDGAAAIVFSYRLKCAETSVTTDWVGEDYAVLNGPATFITLADKVRRPHDLRINLPRRWQKSVCSLNAAPDGAPHHYLAPDFDTLADSPVIVGNPVVAEFEVDGSKHTVAAVGAVAGWDAQPTVHDLERMVRENLRMWGFLPFKRYVFLVCARPGGGGLEHLNSTLVTTNPAALRTERGLGFVSHEYFHSYNVKRLRPIELGPFDYEKAPRTSGLWVAEGLTSYYGELVLSRAGLTKPQNVLSVLSTYITQLQNSPGRLVQSLEQASLDVWTSSFSGVGSGPKTVSYYIKGPVVGFLLDAKIRRCTQGRKSLYDVMRLAYERYSGERGFTAEQFARTAEEVAGADLQEWLQKAISRAEELDYAEALDWFGLHMTTQAGPASKNTWKLELRSDITATQKARLKAWLGADL
jgi:predicted metalloprotease with PDZ domain